MNETFPERLVELQKDARYFTPEKVEQLEIISGDWLSPYAPL